MKQLIAHVHVQVRQVQDPQPVEPAGKIVEHHMVFDHLMIEGVSAGTGVQARNLERVANDGMDRIPVFRMEEANAVAEYASLLFGLHTEALPRVGGAQPCF